MEILIAIVIIGFLLILTLSWGFNFWQEQQINSLAEEVAQALRRAQSGSLFSKMDSSFGVYFGSGQYVLFRGDSYAAREEEEVFFSDASFSGDFSEVVFSRPDGLPSAAGNILITLFGRTETINLNSAGRINRQ